jgi:drug/metabolite transporter (DMT)-like permease
MTHSLTLFTVVLLAGCILAETISHTAFKVVANRAQAERLFHSVVVQPLLWAAIALSVVEAGAWLIVLHHAPLAIAFPVMCLTYACVPLAGALFLNEKMARRQLAGVLLVFVGVLAVSLSGAQGGAQ